MEQSDTNDSLINDASLVAELSANPLLTVAEVARLTRSSEALVRKWHRTRTGPRSAKLGHRIVFRESDVRAWIEAQLADGAPA